MIWEGMFIIGLACAKAVRRRVLCLQQRRTHNVCDHTECMTLEFNINKNAGSKRSALRKPPFRQCLGSSVGVLHDPSLRYVVRNMLAPVVNYITLLMNETCQLAASERAKLPRAGADLNNMLEMG